MYMSVITPGVAKNPCVVSNMSLSPPRSVNSCVPLLMYTRSGVPEASCAAATPSAGAAGFADTPIRFRNSRLHLSGNLSRRSTVPQNISENSIASAVPPSGSFALNFHSGVYARLFSSIRVRTSLTVLPSSFGEFICPRPPSCRMGKPC